MKAAFFVEKGKPLVVRDVPKPKPVKDQVLVKLHAAALNHLDVWNKNEKPAPENGVILGADGSGVIEFVGEDADPLLIGMEVVINPSLNWGPNPIVQGDSFRILGYPDNGTFAEYVVISKKQVFEKPEHLTHEEAAAVPLAALTAYRALFSKARLRAKEKVLITGIGGGAALWAMLFAVAYQARVYVTSSSDEKIKRAKELCASGGFNYKNPDWAQKAAKEAGGFDIVIDCAGGDQFPKFLDLVMPGGRIVNFGRTAGNISELSTRTLYWKQISILGTTMGTRDEFLSMLDFVESRKLKPVIDRTYPLNQINDALQHMEMAGQFGKIVLKINH